MGEDSEWKPGEREAAILKLENIHANTLRSAQGAINYAEGIKMVIAILKETE
jgi:hypothetical protein